MARIVSFALAIGTMQVCIVGNSAADVTELREEMSAIVESYAGYEGHYTDLGREPRTARYSVQFDSSILLLRLKVWEVEKLEQANNDNLWLDRVFPCDLRHLTSISVAEYTYAHSTLPIAEVEGRGEPRCLRLRIRFEGKEIDEARRLQRVLISLARYYGAKIQD